VTGAAGFPKVFAGSIREGAAKQRASARNRIADGFISHHFTLSGQVPAGYHKWLIREC